MEERRIAMTTAAAWEDKDRVADASPPEIADVCSIRRVNEGLVNLRLLGAIPKWELVWKGAKRLRILMSWR